MQKINGKHGSRERRISEGKDGCGKQRAKRKEISLSHPGFEAVTKARNQKAFIKFGARAVGSCLLWSSSDVEEEYGPFTDKIGVPAHHLQRIYSLRRLPWLGKSEFYLFVCAIDMNRRTERQKERSDQKQWRAQAWCSFNLRGSYLSRHPRRERPVKMKINELMESSHRMEAIRIDTSGRRTCEAWTRPQVHQKEKKTNLVALRSNRRCTEIVRRSPPVGLCLITTDLSHARKPKSRASGRM